MPAVWPIYTLGALLPAVVAASYVRHDQFRWYLAASVAVATAATMLGLFSNLTSLREDVPAWAFEIIQALFVPVVAGAIGFLALQNFARVRLMATSMSDAYDSVRFQANDLFASRSRMLAATDRERSRIERDLHDGTQQHFVAMSMQLAALKNQLRAEDTTLRAQVDRLRSDVRDAQRNLRQLTAAIYPPTLTQHGLTSAIRVLNNDTAPPKIEPRIMLDEIMQTSPVGVSLKEVASYENGYDMGPLTPRLPERLKTEHKKVECLPEAVMEQVIHKARIRG